MGKLSLSKGPHHPEVCRHPRLPYAAISEPTRTACFAGEDFATTRKCCCDFSPAIRPASSCYEIEKIRPPPLDYPQPLRPIKNMLDTGYRYWLEADENDEIERNNKPSIFQSSPKEKCCLTHFRQTGALRKLRVYYDGEPNSGRNQKQSWLSEYHPGPGNPVGENY